MSNNQVMRKFKTFNDLNLMVQTSVIMTQNDSGLLSIFKILMNISPNRHH